MTREFDVKASPTEATATATCGGKLNARTARLTNTNLNNNNPASERRAAKFNRAV